MPRKQPTPEEAFTELEQQAAESGCEYAMPEEFEELNGYMQRYVVSRGSMMHGTKIDSIRFAYDDSGMNKRKASLYATRYDHNEKVVKCIKAYRDNFFSETKEKLVPLAFKALEKIVSDDEHAKQLDAARDIFKINDFYTEKHEIAHSLQKAPSIIMALEGSPVEE